MDLNGDGRDDLVSGSWPSKLYYFLATDDGWAEGAELLDPQGEPIEYGQATNVAPIDWDGDGDMDLVAGEFWGGLHVLLNEGGEGVARFAALDEKSQRIDGFDLRGLGSHSGVSTDDWDGDGRTDILLGTGEGAVYWLRDEAEEGAVRLGFPRLLFRERSPVAAADREYCSQVGGRLKLATCDWNGDGKLDLLIGDSQSRRGFRPRPSLDEQALRRFRKLNQRYLELSDRFDAACEERTFWGRGWRDEEQADEAQARVSATYGEMKPLTQELQDLRAEGEPEGGPQGVVWVLLRN